MPTKYLLRGDQIPRHWYNILADLDSPPAPVLHPQTRKPVGPQDLAPLFPMAIIEQEMSTRREVPIPDEVRGALALWRPSPLFRAERMERAIGTRSHIYYKYEGLSALRGSHKPNTAVAQAFYNALALASGCRSPSEPAALGDELHARAQRSPPTAKRCARLPPEL